MKFLGRGIPHEGVWVQPRPISRGLHPAPVAEKSFFQTLMLADDSYWTFGLRLMSGTLLLITILVLALPPILKKVKKKKGEIAV